MTADPGLSHAPLVGAVAAPDLHVMTYNIRRIIRGVRKGSPDYWPGRRGILEQLLQTESPSILGVQEALQSQAAEVGAMLGPHYRRVGRGRNADGLGEGSPLFYDARRVRLVRWSQLALSPTPSVPGSKGWGNLVPRALVDAEFEDRSTGAHFEVLNAHLDHLSRRSRLHSAEMIAQLVQRLPHPSVVMGDFNSSPGTHPYDALLAGGLHDAWVTAADRRGRYSGTFSGYELPKPDRRRIDWIFVTAGIRVPVAAINSARFNGRAPSDHEPVQAVLHIAPA